MCSHQPIYRHAIKTSITDHPQQANASQNLRFDLTDEHKWNQYITNTIWWHEYYNMAINILSDPEISLYQNDNKSIRNFLKLPMYQAHTRIVGNSINMQDSMVPYSRFSHHLND